MKNKHNGGFSLMEVLIAMVILAMIVVPTCTALIMSTRINAKTEALTQAQLAVSSAVETLMAKGIEETELGSDDNDFAYGVSFPGLTVTVKPVTDQSYYEVTVTYSKDGDELVSVHTFIRKGGGA